MSDRKLARILKNCRDLPGSELFQYVDHDGARHSIDSGDVNDYLRNFGPRDHRKKLSHLGCDQSRRRSNGASSPFLFGLHCKLPAVFQILSLVAD